MNVLKEDVASIRAYIGVAEFICPDTGEELYQEKLMIVGVDKDGLIALEFGVFGLPETFLVNKSGKIIYKHLGPLTKEILENEIQPLL